MIKPGYTDKFHPILLLNFIKLTGKTDISTSKILNKDYT